MNSGKSSIHITVIRLINQIRSKIVEEIFFFNMPEIWFKEWIINIHSKIFQIKIMPGTIQFWWISFFYLIYWYSVQ